MRIIARVPCDPSLAIDPRPFGYLNKEEAAFRRLRRAGIILGPYRNSEARKRAEQQPEHSCYTPPCGGMVDAPDSSPGAS